MSLPINDECILCQLNRNTALARKFGEKAATDTLREMMRLYLDAGKNIKEIAKLLGGMHEYKAGLLAKAVSRTDPARLLRAVELCAEADAALKRSSNDYAAIEKLICAL